MAREPSGWQLAIGAAHGATVSSNSLLSYSILEMGIDAAKGETLICTHTCRFEIVVSKLTIVAMVMQNSHAMLLGKVLKSSFGVESLLCSERSHQVNVLQTGLMVSKDRGSSVSLLGK